MRFSEKAWRNNKIIKICLIVVIVLIILISLWFFVIRGFLNYFVPTPFRVTDPGAYLNGDYKEYSGGNQASEYFPEAEELGSYEKIEFLFANNWWKSDPFVRAGNSFMLDVIYSQEEYDAMTLKVIEKYGLKDKESGTNDYEFIVTDEEYLICTSLISKMGKAIEFQFNYRIEVTSSNYEINQFKIMFFDDIRTIRYIFIEKNTGDSTKREQMDLRYHREYSSEDLSYLVKKYFR